MSDARRGRRRIRIGVSACLLGQEVRYDGGHKRDPSLVRALGPFVEWVPVCPEVECGLGTPREAMRLVRGRRGSRLVTIGTGRDFTARMNRYAARRIEALAGEDLCGYVLKRHSPSCGMEGVEARDSRGHRARAGRGLFAERLMQRLPLLPVEDEGRLREPGARDRFIERVFAYRRLRDLFEAAWTPGELVRFHARHEPLLLARSPRACRRLGRLVARAGRAARGDVERRYALGFMKAITRRRP